MVKLKKWLTLPDTASRISVISDGEEVRVADVLQFVEEGHLQLSINLVNGGYGRECVPVNPEELEYDEFPSLGGTPGFKFPRGGRLFQEGETVYQVKKQIIKLERGIWDLPMIGGERFDVRDLLQKLTGGVELDVVVLDGVFLRSPSGTLVEVQERFEQHARPDNSEKPWHDESNFYPSGGLLYEKGDFVVRREALEAFEQQLADPKPLSVDKPLELRERRGLLTALAVACDYAGRDLDLERPSKTAGVLARHAETMGVNLAKPTFEKYFAQIPDAMESRSK